MPTRTSLAWFPFSLATSEPAPTAFALAYDSRDAAPSKFLTTIIWGRRWLLLSC